MAVAVGDETVVLLSLSPTTDLSIGESVVAPTETKFIGTIQVLSCSGVLGGTLATIVDASGDAEPDAGVVVVVVKPATCVVVVKPDAGVLTVAGIFQSSNADDGTPAIGVVVGLDTGVVVDPGIVVIATLDAGFIVVVKEATGVIIARLATDDGKPDAGVVVVDKGVIAVGGAPDTGVVC